MSARPDYYDFPAAPEPPQPLFDPAAHRFGRFLESEPERRRMLIPDFLPLNVVGLQSGMGGAGKSALLYQLAISTATGAPFLEMDMEEVGGVLCLFAEDDEPELHRRGRGIVEHLETRQRIDRGALSERLVVVSRVSEPNMLTSGREGEVVRTQLVEQLIAAARLVPDLKLIVLDPVSRFRGGRANAEEDSTRFVEALEAVRAETGATVLAAVHVNKASIRDPGESDQAAVRGSSALVDGVRWCAQMTRMRRDAAKNYGVPADEADRYVRLDLVKTNYTRPWPGLWLRREAGGVLLPADLTRDAELAQQEHAQQRYADVVQRVVRLLEAEGPMTQTRMERDYAGAHGALAVGKGTLRSILGRAVSEGILGSKPDPAGRGGRLLTTAPAGS